MPHDYDSDFLHGASQIGAFMGIPTRRAHYMLEQRLLPAAKLGRIWTARKSRIIAHLEAAEDATLATGAEAA
jgi:hypothetical protein